MKQVNKEFVKLIVWDIILIVLGTLFCVLPQTAMVMFETICSVLLIAYGLICISFYVFISSKDTNWLVEGVVYIVIGLFVTFISSLFIIAIGLILIINGTRFIMFSMNLKFMGEKNWLFDFCVGVFLILIGVVSVIISFTDTAEKLTSILVGLFLILNGASDLVTVFAVHKNYFKLRRQISRKNVSENDIGDNGESSQNSDKGGKSSQTDYSDFKDYDIK